MTYASMVSEFSSKLKDLYACENCSCVLPTLEYHCLNKFCNSGQSTFMGYNEWYHSLASPNSVRQNLWTLIPSTKWCAFIQSFEWSRCASASSLGFPENSGLKLDQWRYTTFCCWPAWSWFYCCCCCSCCCWCCWFGGGLGAGTPPSWSAIFILHYIYSNPKLYLFICIAPIFTIYILSYLLSCLLSVPYYCSLSILYLVPEKYLSHLGVLKYLLPQFLKIQLIPDDWIEICSLFLPLQFPHIPDVEVTNWNLNISSSSTVW